MCRAIRIALPVCDLAGFANYEGALRAFGADSAALDAGAGASGFDGLLLPGGGDCDPALYGQDMDPNCEPFDRALDDRQLAALDAFATAKKPVLGICRGHQLINVYFGGTLVQHLRQSGRHARLGRPDDRVHPTRAAKGAFLAALYGEAFSVNSSHHQAVDAAGEGIEIVQWSDDGVVEGLRHRALPVYGVQWHPERMCLGHHRDDTVDGADIFRFFLDQCRR